ncbi:TetR/AcrR family transcriptional regulator [Dactylosporangium sp. NPDC005572]|uniref:TetR/AcrR family transcriptional regulator n=1 Tax=Dactylosporangium sp. NPDC005572 TaxID=3156889 RepID=UPI0033B02140
MPPETPLSREVIVAAGRRLAEEGGAAALSMRRVATEVGCSPMALYRHVADKRELLILVLEDVARGLRPDPPEGAPQEQLEALFVMLHDYLAGYPWVVEVLRQGELFAPSALRFVEAALAVLERAGCTGDDALLAYSALWNYTVGTLVWRRPEGPEAHAARTAISALAPLAELPRVRRLWPLLPGLDRGQVFRAGLRALVSGLLTSA